MQIDLPNDDFQRLAGWAAAAGYKDDVPGYLLALANAAANGPADENPPSMPIKLSAEQAIATLGAGVIGDPTAGSVANWTDAEPVAAWVGQLRELRCHGVERRVP